MESGVRTIAEDPLTVRPKLFFSEFVEVEANEADFASSGPRWTA
jgi:hypothetical protein